MGVQKDDIFILGSGYWFLDKLKYRRGHSVLDGGGYSYAIIQVWLFSVS